MKLLLVNSGQEQSFPNANPPAHQQHADHPRRRHGQLWSAAQVVLALPIGVLANSAIAIAVAVLAVPLALITSHDLYVAIFAATYGVVLGAATLPWVVIATLAVAVLSWIAAPGWRRANGRLPASGQLNPPSQSGPVVWCLAGIVAATAAAEVRGMLPPIAGWTQATFFPLPGGVGFLLAAGTGLLASIAAVVSAPRFSHRLAWPLPVTRLLLFALAGSVFAQLAAFVTQARIPIG